MLKSLFTRAMLRKASGRQNGRIFGVTPKGGLGSFPFVKKLLQIFYILGHLFD